MTMSAVSLRSTSRFLFESNANKTNLYQMTDGFPCALLSTKCTLKVSFHDGRGKLVGQKLGLQSWSQRLEW